MSWTRKGKDLTLKIVVNDPASHWLCSDTLLIQVGTQIQVVNIFMHGTHNYTFKNLSDKDNQFIAGVGVQPFLFCDNVVNLIPDLFKTIGLFLGGLDLIPNVILPFVGPLPMKVQEELNVEFIKKATGYEWKKRSASPNIPSKDKIKSGDYFPVTRFDGLDQIIEYGTGSHSGHSVVAVWDKRDGELYIVESQDSWYWPLGKGLQRNKFDDWMTQAQKIGFNVSHMPLRPDIAEKFDEVAVWKWFDTVKGMPYGYRNFLFSWIDTQYENAPPLLDLDFAWLAFTLLSKVDKEIGNLMVGEAMNKRLGTTGLDLVDINIEAAKQGKNIRSLMAEVETEGWMYSDGLSYVCSCFVAAIWKRGGLFGDLEINSTEFTPRDVYQVKFFDETTPLDASCIKNDPTLPYCQLFGNHLMEMPGYNTVEPYAHMNDYCSGLPPNYERPEGC